jgi:hypothetical protein
MSEQAPEARPRSSGNVFTRKVGPLSMWVWMLIALVIAILYYLYKKNSESSSSTSTAAAAAGNAPGGVDSSLVPQFVNQVYNQETPPAAPNITVNNTVPPPPTVTPPPTPVAKATPPAPSTTTISGSPGSYTTGLPGGMNEWTSTGKYSLNTIAKSHGMTAQQLIASSEAAENNTGLKAYVAKGNYNAPVPAGVELFIPNANWPTKKL